MRVLVVFLCFWTCQGREVHDKSDRYLIACHTTDFTCFQRQFSALRDHVLLGNTKLAIEDFEPYAVQYGNSCVRILGWAESELIGIGMDSTEKALTLALELPMHMQQVHAAGCTPPEREFTDIAALNQTNRRLMEFTANATVTATFPFRLLKKKGDVYLILDEEDLDTLVDIPIYVLEGSEVEAAELNRASEWAFSVVQHIDAAQEFAAPFTSRLRLVLERVPLKRLMLLYPEEEYSDLNFAFLDLDTSI